MRHRLHRLLSVADSHAFRRPCAPRCATILALVAIGIVAGCGGATFVQTDNEFAPSAGTVEPEVFLDRRPDRPYRSVGIIEVESNSALDRIVKIAQKKGKKVGCELLVDRTIHQVGNVDPIRSGCFLEEESALRLRHECTPPPSRVPQGMAFPRVCGQARHSYSTPIIAPQPGPSSPMRSTPVSRREFICGIYTGEYESVPALVTAPNQTASGLWDSLVGDRHDAAACRTVFDLLHGDENCEGEQCRPAAALSRIFITRCRQAEAEGTKEAQRWRRAWKERAPGPPPDTCYANFLRAAQSAQIARTFAEKCLVTRGPGVVERTVIERVTGSPLESVDGPATTSEDTVEAPLE